MGTRKILISALAVMGFAGALAAQTGQPAAGTTKIAVLNVQGALLGTKDGQQLAKDLDAKYAPKQKQLESQRSELASLQADLQRTSNTLSPEKRPQMEGVIDDKTRRLTRDQQDAREEFTGDQQRMVGPLSQRLMQAVAKYAKDNGYALVLSADSDLIYATSSIDITQDIIKLYDSGAASTPPAAASPAKAQPGTTAPHK